MYKMYCPSEGTPNDESKPSVERSETAGSDVPESAAGIEDTTSSKTTCGCAYDARFCRMAEGNFRMEGGRGRLGANAGRTDTDAFTPAGAQIDDDLDRAR